MDHLSVSLGILVRMLTLKGRLKQRGPFFFFKKNKKWTSCFGVVHRLWRKGGSEGGRGCTFPHWLCNRLQGALRDSIAEHGVWFCHRLRKAALKKQKYGKALVKKENVSVSVKNSLISIRARLPESREGERERERKKRDARLYWKLRLTFAVLGSSALFQGLREPSQKVSCWIVLH